MLLIVDEVAVPSVLGAMRLGVFIFFLQRWPGKMEGMLQKLCTPSAFWLSFVLGVAGARPVFAEPRALRFAAVAPEGTGWAREARSFARIIEHETNGQVSVKWYLGGVAGDDTEMGARVHRGQLDGVASAGPLCESLAPSMRVLHVPGLYRDRDEWAYVMSQLRPEFDKELQRAGFVNLGEAGLGPSIVLSRAPIASMNDLKRTKLWLWDSFDVMRKTTEAMNLRTVALPLPRASQAYEDGQSDGFLAIPTAALAFQWSVQARYFSELHTNYLALCLIISNRAMDQLPIEHQRAIRAAGARMVAHFDDLGREQDKLLLGGLFERQGLKRVPVSDAFRNEFFEAAKAARDRLGDSLVPHELLERVISLQASYRASPHD